MGSTEIMHICVLKPARLLIFSVTVLFYTEVIIKTPKEAQNERIILKNKLKTLRTEDLAVNFFVIFSM